ncbi:patellin-3 [Melia azedarach]|uniref:Patellin-3 n=1 Tax=Melia azedarach TaxID=155640 RepID=A0ACC1WPV4_MELAZ|nr:patellin-3 [Melia azedarach]
MSEESHNSTPPPLPAVKQDPPPPPVAEESEPASTAATEKEGEKPPPPPVAEESEPASTAATGKEDEKPPPPSAAAAVENRSLAAMMEKETSSPTAAEKKKEVVVVVDEAEKEKEKEKEKTIEERKVPQSLISFKEESNIVADLSDLQKKALQELKQLVQEALNNRQFGSPPPPPPPPKEEEKQSSVAQEGPKTEQVAAVSSDAPKTEAHSSDSDVSTEIKPPQEESQAEVAKEVHQESKEEPKTADAPEEVSIWGVPLLKDDRSDVILLKFLRARDFKVRDAFIMIKNTIQWRKEFGIDALLDEDLGDDLEKVVFMHGYDRDGHPVCYNVYGEFQNKELYQKTFADEEKRMNFLRWRIQFLERSIRKLDFKPGGVCTIFQVNDLKNSPGPGKRELRIATKQALQLLQDNYPEFVAKQVFINVPWWYLAFYTMISPFMTQRTKSKFVFAGPSKSPETLFKYTSPEHVPIQYGGLSVDYCDCNPEFTIDDPATEITVKPGTKQTVEIIIYEKCTIVWEIRVVGWEVSYGAEFVPDEKDKYTIIIQKPTKMSPTDEPVVSHRFKVDELGKVLLTVDNPTSKRKKLLYRFKVESFSN